MREVEIGPATRVNAAPGSRLVLNAGSGPHARTRLHPVFHDPNVWTEVRLDIDEAVKPDIVASITNLDSVNPGTMDAVWCSHNLEHLHTHEINTALAQFRRVLRSDGFALITLPDLEEIARLVIDGRLEEIAYQSPAGPITALDMIYGHSASIEVGRHYMAHHTGFTVETLGRRLADAEFAEVLVTKGTGYDIWALALMPRADKDLLANEFYGSGIDFFSDSMEEA
jgi:SAM-dependent methyltransferase